jgi:hypothetical protein
MSECEAVISMIRPQGKGLVFVSSSLVERSDSCVITALLSHKVLGLRSGGCRTPFPKPYVSLGQGYINLFLHNPNHSSQVTPQTAFKITEIPSHEKAVWFEVSKIGQEWCEYRFYGIFSCRDITSKASDSGIKQ